MPLYEHQRLPRPRSLREVPGYLARLCSSFFRRLWYIVRLVWETRRWILLVMTLLALLNGVLPIAGAYISAELINELARAYMDPGSVALAAILVLLVLQFVYLLIRNLLGTGGRMVSRIAGELVTDHIKRKIMRKAQDIDMASFDMPEFFSRLENANREAGMRPLQILEATFNTLSAIISLVGFIAVLWGISPWAPLVIFVLSVPSAVINLIYRKKTFRYIRHRSKDRRQMAYYSDLLTNKDMAKEIRIFDLADDLTERYSSVFSRYFSGLRRLFLGESVWSTLSGILTVAVNAALMLYVALGVFDGRWEIGDYSLYTGALSSVITGVATVIAATSTVYEGTLFIDNLMSFMQEEKTLVAIGDTPRIPQRGVGHTIEFRDVSFRYPGTERDVLRHIDLTFAAGETVMLVGLNGAGKTTLIKLLTRLYDPTEGVILLDGEDIRTYDVDELYRIFGIIFQDFGKYAVSTADNIRFGDIHRAPDAAAVEEAAVQASADEFIRRLPQGYDTPLMRYFEENGIELSIGQWQKLSVARAFYSGSDVLILDEPTASLDPLAEQEIYRQFDMLREGRTTVLVSHRLSSATVASKVIVLENGEVEEVGTHAELMQARGRYYELFSTQASRYLETPVEPPVGTRPPRRPNDV